MAHTTTNLIHSIKVGNATYEIHDAQAIHSIEELGLGTALVFKGVKDTKAELPSTGNKVGDVWHVKADDYEYVWAMVEGTTGSWEEFGAPHNFAAADHIHDVTVTGKNASSAVTGSATVTGGNSSSTVTGTASITAQSVSANPKYAKVTSDDDTFVKSYSGTSGKLVKTKLTPVGSTTSAISSVTGATGSITGVSGATQASRASVGTPLAGAKVGSEVTVATSYKTNGNVIGGSPAEWEANVNNGVLEFSFKANAPTAVTLPTLNTTKITPAAALTIPQYTFIDVTVPKAASAATTVVTSVSSETVDVAVAGSEIDVATGSITSSGTGSAVLTGLGTATTAKALTSATLAEATGASDGVHTGDDVSANDYTYSGTISGTAAAQTWTQNTGSISGTAAAQTWTQQSGTTGEPK